MMISIIAAIGKNRELGKGNKLLWKIPGDLPRFKKLTTGHVVIMGRKTYESIGRSLPDRMNIVITRDLQWKHEGIITVHSINDALDTARKHESEEIFIIGGGQIYEQALPLSDRLYLTLVNKTFPKADTFFPEYKSLFTKVISREKRHEESISFEYEIRER